MWVCNNEKEEIMENIQNKKGYKGWYGPNDTAYAVNRVRKAAEDLINASSFWSWGARPIQYAKVMPKNHPIFVALRQLAKFDKKYCIYANIEHDPALFLPVIPSKEVLKQLIEKATKESEELQKIV